MDHGAGARHVRYFLHVATLGRYTEILNETVTAILASPHMAATDRIEIGVVGDGPIDLRHRDSRITIARTDPDVTAFEFPTLDMLHHFARTRPDAVVVYLNCLGGRYVGADYEIRRRWRAMLVYLLLDRRPAALAALAGADVCGVEWTRLPLPHMTSNNWMANARYVAALPPPAAYRETAAATDLSRFGERWESTMVKRRHAGEFWIGANPAARAVSLLPISRLGLPRTEFDSTPWWALPGIDWPAIAIQRHEGTAPPAARMRFLAQTGWFNALFLARAAKRRVKALLPVRSAPQEHRV